MQSKKSIVWNQEDDQEIEYLYELVGPKWELISSHFNENSKLGKKDAKQIRERWTHILNPKNKKSWTEQETIKLFAIQEKAGNHWAQISKSLPGKTDNMVKDHFYNVIRTGLRRMLNKLEVKNPTEKTKNIKTSILSQIRNQAQKYDYSDWNLKSRTNLLSCLNENAKVGLNNLHDFVSCHKEKLSKEEEGQCKQVIDYYTGFLSKNEEVQLIELIPVLGCIFTLYLILWSKNLFERKGCSKDKKAEMAAEEDGEERLVGSSTEEVDEFFTSIIDLNYWNKE